MPSLTLQIRTSIRPFQVVSAQTIRMQHLFGLPLNSKDGQEIPDSTFDFYIQAAYAMLENALGLKFAKQLVEETRDFNLDNWTKWGYMRVTYPVVCPVKLDGFLGTTRQVHYPRAWLSTRKTSDGKTYSRQINLVPTQNTSQSDAIIYSGIMPQAGFFSGHSQIPNYWNVAYVTGYDEIPYDIMQALGMLAAFPILGLLGDIMLPWPGIASKSISIDGLSQSISSYVNGTSGAFGARLKQYQDQLFDERTGMIELLKNSYSAIIWATA